MKIQPLVDRAQGLPFKQIEGAMELASLSERGGRLPALFFVPADETAGANTLASGAIDQRVAGEFLAVLQLGSEGRREGAISDALDDLAQAVIDRFLGWTMPGAATPVTYGGGRLVGLQPNQITWAIRFRTARHLRKNS